jgi:small-conductance mechanosensitive channel
MNASNLGVTFYNTTLYCPLTKISDQIYEIEIRMLTDTGQPYTIPNSAIVSLELALTY